MLLSGLFFACWVALLVFVDFSGSEESVVAVGLVESDSAN